MRKNWFSILSSNRWKIFILLLKIVSARVFATEQSAKLLRPVKSQILEQSTRSPQLDFASSKYDTITKLESKSDRHLYPPQYQAHESEILVVEDGSIENLDSKSNGDNFGSLNEAENANPSPLALTQEEISLVFRIASNADHVEGNTENGDSGDKALSVNSFVMEHFVVTFENYRDHLSGISRRFPWAGVMQFLVSINVVCPIVSFVQNIFVSRPSVGIQTNQGHPQNPDGTLPRPWKDLRGYEEYFIDEDTVEAERTSYYFIYRMYDTFYAYATESTEHKELLNPIAPGWGPQRIHFRNATSIGGQWRESPFSVVTERAGHVIVAMRGTIYQDEYEASSLFHFTEPVETESYFPGKVHYGAFNLFKDMLPPLLLDIESRKPRRITLVGHSVGGVIATMLGAYLGQKYAKIKKEGHEQFEIEVLTIGSYAPGNKDFWEAAKGYMNVRNLKYLGEGWIDEDGEGTEKMYTMGDVVAQAPGVSLPTCTSSETSPTGGKESRKGAYWNDYYMPPCTVAIYPSSLPNTQAWRTRTNMLDPASMTVAMNHKCPYTCWLTSGTGDPDTRCYFEEQIQEQQQGVRAWIGSLWAQNKKMGASIIALQEGEICRKTKANLQLDLDSTRDPRVRGSRGQM
jgi:hypothetical protein